MYLIQPCNNSTKGGQGAGTNYDRFEINGAVQAPSFKDVRGSSVDGVKERWEEGSPNLYIVRLLNDIVYYVCWILESAVCGKMGVGFPDRLQRMKMFLVWFLKGWSPLPLDIF